MNTDTDYRNSTTGRETARLYADIISRQEPELIRPRQSLINRAKIFAPYDALTGYDAEIDSIREEQKEVPRIDLSDEEKEILSGRLTQIRRGMKVTVRYFQRGEAADIGNYIDLTGVADHIDPVGRCLFIGSEHRMDQDENGKISRIPPVRICFDDLIDIRSGEMR